MYIRTSTVFPSLACIHDKKDYQSYAKAITGFSTLEAIIMEQSHMWLISMGLKIVFYIWYETLHGISGKNHIYS